jgi:hypothetical protein
VKKSVSKNSSAKQRDAETFKLSNVKADASSEAGLSMREGTSKNRLDRSAFACNKS